MRSMTETGQELLDQLNPVFTNDPDIRGTVGILANEVDNVEVRIQEVLEALRAEGTFLEVWERLFSVPVPGGATEAQRRAALRLYFRRLSRGANGSTWEDRMTEIIGSSWRYHEGVNFIGTERYRFAKQSDFTTFTYDLGSATDLWSSSEGEDKLVMKWGNATFWNHATRNESDYYGEIALTVGDEAGLWGLLLKRQSNGNALGFLIDESGAFGIYRTSISGDELVIDSTFVTDTVTVAPGDKVWLRGYTEGNDLTLDVFLSDPALDGTPAETVTHTLTGSWITYYGVGVFGDYGATLSTASPAWAVTDLILGTYYGLSTPDYTIRITIPYEAGGTRAGSVETIARSLTPAHLDIITEYDVGFLLGVSELGEEAL